MVLRPWWLLAAALALAPPVLAALARRRGRSAPTLSVVIQCVALVLAAAALAGVALPFGAKAFKPCLLLSDVSGSARGQSDVELPWPDGLVRKRYTFAAGVGPLGQKVDPTATNVGVALKAAAAEAADASGVVIRTDGHFTDAWQAAAEALGRTGVDVMVVPMDSPPFDVRVVDLVAKRGSGKQVTVTVSLATNMPGHWKLTVWRTGAKEKLLEREQDVIGATTVRLTDTLPENEAAEYRVKLSRPKDAAGSGRPRPPSDEFAENDEASALVLPRLRRLAVIWGRQGGEKVHAMLVGMGVRAERVLPAEAPTTEAGWSRYAGVVLMDATGLLLSSAQREALAAFVRNGGGLVLIGACPHRTVADRSDPLSEVSALMANPYERRAMKVTVVLDASGSMGELTTSAHGTQQVKFAVAADAVMALKRHLTPRDALAVMTFAKTPRDVYDSRDGPIDFRQLRDALGKVKPGGPTRVGPALTRAVSQPPAKDRTELIIVLSDLVTEPFDAKATEKLFRDSGRKLAIVATASPGQDPKKATDLMNLAFRLDIRPKPSENLRGLAEIFAGFLSEHRGSAVRTGGPFAVTARGKPFGADVEGIAALSSYVLSAPQVRTDVLLRAGADALLGARPVGLGRSVTLAADLTDPPNVAWQTSAQAAALIRAAAQWTLRRAPDARYAGTGVDTGRTWAFRFDARDPSGAAINALDLTLHVEPVKGTASVQDIPLPQVAPGIYRAELVRPAEAFLVTVLADTKGPLWHGAYGHRAAPEFRAVGANWPNLRRLAGLTGGRIVSSRDVGRITGQWNRRQYTDIWPALAGLALVLVLIDWVAARTWKRWS